MKFHLNYLLEDEKTEEGVVLRKAGTIVSYTEADDSEHNECPADCGTLVFAAPFRELFDSNFNVAMKVDVMTKKLVQLNPTVIPEALND